jgi:uncharacterized DUF497 family protein
VNDAFRWNEWNLDHATRHGVTVAEIESVVLNARSPYPQKIGDGKKLVIGRGNGGRFIQVIYVTDADGTFYVIHAMPIRVR